MGLFSKKNKEFSGSPNQEGRTSQDSDTSPTGTHRRNTLHKRPPVPIDTDPTTHDQPTSQPSSALPPYSGGNGAVGYSDVKHNPDQKLAYDDGGVGAAGTRRADMASSHNQNDPYMDGTATGLQQQQQHQQQNTNAANTGSIGRKAGLTDHHNQRDLGATGTMSNQVYEKSPTSGTRAGLAGAGMGAAAGAGLAGHHRDQQRLSNDPNLQGYTSNSPQTGMAGHTGTGAGIAPGHGHESFAMLSIDTARAKLRAAEEKEDRALQMMAEARVAAQEAKETIEKYAAQVDEEIRLASLKQKDAMGLRQQGEHLGRV